MYMIGLLPWLFISHCTFPPLNSIKLTMHDHLFTDHFDFQFTWAVFHHFQCHTEVTLSNLLTATALKGVMVT